MKLTRKQIQEGLKATPIEDILLGHNNPAGVTLTAKQRAFAEDVAKGTPKAKAYRNHYDTNAKPQTQAHTAHVLANQPKIQATIEAFKVAIEAQKYLFPAHLRAMAIQKLTEKALDDTLPPSQQLKALELIGKMSEVALFTERKEVITHNTSADAKSKLIASLMTAINTSKTLSTDKKAEAQSLLDEITRGREPVTVEHEAKEASELEDVDAVTGSGANVSEGEEIGDIDTPPDATPQKKGHSMPAHMHSIPDKQLSSEINDMHPTSQVLQEDNNILSSKNNDVPILDEVIDEGVPPIEILRTEVGVDLEKTPLDDLDTK
jgi:hypothetical protein